MTQPIYLDYAATTPVDPRVVEIMLRYLSNDFGNPSSLSHPFGLIAKKAIEEAREQVADLIHAEPAEIIWTSGATESINLALKGAVQLYQRKGKHIVTLKTEHKAVLDTCQQLEKEGYQVTYLTPETTGLLDLEKFKAALRPDTILVSILHLNNETGVIQDLDSLAKITAEREILLHVDAAQSVGKIAIDVSKTPIDLLSLNAHKVYGPKGIGALYTRRKPRVRVAAQMHGGGQEQGMRSGTLATHQIAGMGAAYHFAKLEMSANYKKVAAFRELLWQAISQLKNTAINGDITRSYPGILNVYIPGLKAENFMQLFPELAVSAGSACTSKGIEPSYVLRAMGMSAKDAHCSIRFSVGKFTTEEEIKMLANFLLKRLIS